jgi:hypothetical protein
LPGSAITAAAGIDISVGVVAGVEAGVVAGVVSAVPVSPPAEPFDGSVPEARVVVTNAAFSTRVVSEPDESELELPHEATAIKATAKMAHFVTRDFIWLLHIFQKRICL